jgi:hypothetical protein
MSSAPRLHDFAHSLRLIRQRDGEPQSRVPLGAVGMLMQIDQLPAACHARELSLWTGLDPSTSAGPWRLSSCRGWSSCSPIPRTDAAASW